ncbi:outer membrane protein transport protein [uncultured Marinobacter sp.]|uniref:OmpP1/FadL family transporter n=1 Tax=uncultured Marinobacter sp. TaxID=187379 RepID=UPI00344D7971
MAKSAVWQLCTTLLCGLALPSAQAGMGNLGTSYGLMPQDVATAQGLSMFTEEVSATYYNPSYITADERGELTAGILHAEQELRTTRSDARGNVLANAPTQHVLLGFKSNLASLTRDRHPIHVGIILGLEKYGKEMMAFRSETSDTGQYLQFGKQPMFLNAGVGTGIADGVSIGASVRLTLKASAELEAHTTLAGDMSQESLTVNAKPSLKAILGTTIEPAKLFCDDACIWDGWELALIYRTKSSSSTSVEADVVVNKTVPEPGLSLAVTTIEAFQPETYAVGLQYSGERWRTAVSLEQQRWSELVEEFAGDTIKDQAELPPSERIQFDDVLSPRVGAEYQLNETYSVSGGLAYETSPLRTERNPGLNYYDTDRAVFGLGFAAVYNRTPVFSYPVRLDFAYQYQQLIDRDFLIVDGSGNETSVAADGDIHVVSTSITFKF